MSEQRKEILDKNLSPFQRLVRIMAILRSEEGCAWDRKQTHLSLLPYLIEETYEVQEAIEAEDWSGLKEELGDLMCQIVFHSQLAAERNIFDINDAINVIADKLVARHPHVFGEKKALSPDQVRNQWEQIKVESGEKKSVLSGLPRSMPSLTMAYRMGEKAAGIGFDWNNPAQVVAKLEEELAEVKAEIKSGDREALADEIGDLLFAVASLARKCEINPELALKKALDKFKHRFDLLEEQIKSSDKKFRDYTLDELENIWQQIKL